MDVEEKDFLGIMGKSGCGKSTLLRVLGLLDRPTEGKLYFEGFDTEELWKDELADIRRRKIGFIFPRLLSDGQSDSAGKYDSADDP